LISEENEEDDKGDNETMSKAEKKRLAKERKAKVCETALKYLS
jgi:hypothetical protein